MCFIFQKLETFVQEELGMTRPTVLVCLSGSGRIWTHATSRLTTVFKTAAITRLCHTSFDTACQESNLTLHLITMNTNGKWRVLQYTNAAIAELGLEPRTSGYEPDVLPLHYSAI